MKTIVVTGGAGFVGSHTCKALARDGYPSFTFHNLERGHDGWSNGGRSSEVTFRNENDLSASTRGLANQSG